uniref:Uncharacterized protein n=1 Tax=Anguilla anguilla TaxID=7936 RepID=A0A0E9T7N4_ANGAN
MKIKRVILCFLELVFPCQTLRKPREHDSGD